MKKIETQDIDIMTKLYSNSGYFTEREIDLMLKLLEYVYHEEAPKAVLESLLQVAAYDYSSIDNLLASNQELKFRILRYLDKYIGMFKSKESFLRRFVLEGLPLITTRNTRQINDCVYACLDWEALERSLPYSYVIIDNYVVVFEF